MLKDPLIEFSFTMDKDLMYKHNVPYDRVREVCLLHDVVRTLNSPLMMLERSMSTVDLRDALIFTSRMP